MDKPEPGVRNIRLPVPDPVEVQHSNDEFKTQLAYKILNTKKEDVVGPAA